MINAPDVQSIDEIADALKKSFGSADGYFAMDTNDRKKPKEALRKSRGCGLPIDGFPTYELNTKKARHRASGLYCH